MTYEHATDAKGRARAESVAFVESTSSRVAASGGKNSGRGLPMLAVLFFAFVGALWAGWQAAAGCRRPVCRGEPVGICDLCLGQGRGAERAVADGGEYLAHDRLVRRLAGSFGGAARAAPQVEQDIVSGDVLGNGADQLRGAGLVADGKGGRGAALGSGRGGLRAAGTEGAVVLVPRWRRQLFLVQREFIACSLCRAAFRSVIRSSILRWAS